MAEGKHYHLVGIKGVAMTALAGILLDAGHQVTGCDVAEDFVTAKQLQKLGITSQIGFETQSLPCQIQAVVFSGAHGGSSNPLVIEAKRRGLEVYSHMRCLAEFFNAKRGVAVCGVGGKSTISGMLAYVCEQLDSQSYAVGVGEIIGLERTGKYLPEKPFFIVEADEYVEDPSIKSDSIVPRMSFLRPEIIICSNLKFDHPDVYRDFAHTQSVYQEFFLSLPVGGSLIYYGDDVNLTALVAKVKKQRSDINYFSYGESSDNDYQLNTIPLQLRVPGIFNQLNALATLVALKACGFSQVQILSALSGFSSVKRRLELVQKINQADCWDDYAHHPSELKAVIKALQERYPQKKLLVAFQPHTYSRTKSLLPEFAEALAGDFQTLLLDIFPSAREEPDPSISSDILVERINQFAPASPALNLHGQENLAIYLKQNLNSNTVFATLGAGDIYHLYDLFN